MKINAILQDEPLRVASRRWKELHRGTFSRMFADGAGSAMELIPNFSACDYTGSAEVEDFSEMFRGREAMENAPLFDTRNGKDFSNMFDGCVALKSVPAYDLGKAESLTGFVDGCREVSKFGCVNINASLDLSSCRKLKGAELRKVIANLNEAVGKHHVLSLGKQLLERLEPEDIAVANAKGWTLC